MTQNKDSGGEERGTGDSRSVGHSDFANEVSATTWFSADGIRDRLNSGEVPMALLQASTTMERILYLKLRDRFDVSREAFESSHGSMTLGWYLQTCNSLGLTDEEYRDELDDLVDKRNDLAHEFGYHEKIEEETDEQQEVIRLIEVTCDWIDSTEP